MDKLDGTIVCIARESERECFAGTPESILEWQREVLKMIRKPKVWNADEIDILIVKMNMHLLVQGK